MGGVSEGRCGKAAAGGDGTAGGHGERRAAEPPRPRREPAAGNPAAVAARNPVAVGEGWKSWS